MMQVEDLGPGFFWMLLCLWKGEGRGAPGEGVGERSPFLMLSGPAFLFSFVFRASE